MGHIASTGRRRIDIGPIGIGGVCRIHSGECGTFFLFIIVIVMIIIAMITVIIVVVVV